MLDGDEQASSNPQLRAEGARERRPGSQRRVRRHVDVLQDGERGPAEHEEVHEVACEGTQGFAGGPSLGDELQQPAPQLPEALGPVPPGAVVAVELEADHVQDGAGLHDVLQHEAALLELLHQELVVRERLLLVVPDGVAVVDVGREQRSSGRESRGRTPISDQLVGRGGAVERGVEAHQRRQHAVRQCRVAQEECPAPAHRKSLEAGPEPGVARDVDPLLRVVVVDARDVEVSSLDRHTDAEPGRDLPEEELVEAVLEVDAGAMRNGGVALARTVRSVEQHLRDGTAARQRGVGRAAV